MKEYDYSVLITCEHGGNNVPVKYQDLFKGYATVLQSHQGWDPGALSLARDLAKILDAKLFYSTTTRLLVDLNRSLHHPDIFSEIVGKLSDKDKKSIIDKYYTPYRVEVEEHIRQQVKQGYRVIHLSIHSFVPRLNNKERNTDIGLLYDPGRKPEKEFCRLLKGEFNKSISPLRIRRNYPYRGTADGFTTWLRRRFRERDYSGIEIETNQRLFAGRKPAMSPYKKAFLSCFLALLDR